MLLWFSLQLMSCQNTSPNANPKIEHDCHEMPQVTCLHTHQPKYYSNLDVMLFLVEYNNSIPFGKLWFSLQLMSCQSTNPNTNPKIEHECHEMSQVTCLHTHQPKYY